MHDTSLINAKLFFDTYQNDIRSISKNTKLIEIGSQDVNGSIRQVSPPDFEYIGLDFVHGKGVDLILDDPYRLPFEDGTIDVCVSNSCFEHSEFFWLTYLEIMRVLKPTGLFYLNAPSNGAYHRYPVDCWRFYPDSGHALVNWGKANKINGCLLESYTGYQVSDIWNDFVAIFLKDASFENKFNNRITDVIDRFDNGWNSKLSGNILNYQLLPEDKRKVVS